MAIGIGTASSLLGAAVASYAVNTITSKIFGPKQDSSSPTYSFGTLQTQANSNLAMPVIYGKVKLAGNSIWQGESGKTVHRIVAFGVGKCKSVSGVRLNDIPIEELPGCSYTAYMGDGEQEIDSRLIYHWPESEREGKTQADFAKIVGGLKYDAYLAITAEASDKLSGSINITATWEGREVRVFSSPGVYDTAWSDNPAFCALDFYSSVDGFGIQDDGLDIQSFITAAAYYQPGDGSRNYSLNLVLDEKKTRQDWLGEIMACCRSYPTYQRGLHGILVDKPEPVSQVFTVLPTDEVEVWPLELSEMLERIIIKYPDPEYEWTRVGAPATITTQFRHANKPLEKTIEINGVTNFDQASRLAWFHLNQAQTCKTWIRFKTNKRAMNRSVGDVIGIRDPILNVVEPGLNYKRYRIMTMTEPQNGSIELVCLEYNNAIYTEQKGSVAPVINITKLPNPAAIPPDVTNIQLGQVYYRQKDGTIVSYITGQCTLPEFVNFSEAFLHYSENNGENWHDGGKVDTDGTFTINNAKTGANYVVRIKVRNRMGIVSNGATAGPIYITGKDAPPSNVPGFAAAIDLSDSTKVKLSWSAVTDIDLAGYQIAEGSSIIELCWTGTNYTYTATASRQHNFSVKAVDNSGNQSAVPATKSITVTIEPTKVAGFNYAIQETDRSRVLFSWTANGEKDLSYYELREGQLWETATVIAPQLKATSYQHVLTTEGSKTYLVKAFNVAGNESTEASSVTMQVILRPDTPTNLQVQQEPKDRSLLKLSWTASFGKDIAGYEIRKGTVWDTGEIIAFAKDTAYWYSIPSSGTYEFMIRAKTVVGQLSNIANVSATVMIEAYDVTGFTAIQMIADRTKVRLSWDASLSLDISHHEIRKGSTWDTAAIIDKQATGTFYDVIVTDETPQTFWIKAVSVAGKYSQNAAKVEDIFNMNPSPVTNIQLSQDVNDKSILIITWTGISESDLIAYEIRVGYTWETSEKIGETKEQHWSYRPTQTGNIKVIIKSKNAARYYSDEASANYYATLEPLVVTGFQVLQNGEYVEFFWNKSDEPDVIAYEIREGTSFELGILVDSGITLNSHKAKVDQEREYRYHIKAINRSNRYSQSSASQSVIVSKLPPKNIILSYDEIARADGTHSNTEFGASLINFSNIGSRWSDYLTTRFSDVGGQVVLKLAKEVKDGFYVSPFLSEMGTYYQSGIYTCETIDVGQVITANITNRFTSTVNLKNAGLAKIQIRTSRDGEKWTEWQDFRPAEYTFRYLGRRALLATDDITKTPEINQFVTMIDVDDFEQTGTVTVPVGGGTFLYPKQYYTVPILTPTAFGDNRFFHVTEKTKTGFSGYVADRAGNDVGGQLDYRTRGY